MHYNDLNSELRHQRRSVDGCSPGRGGIVQNGGTRGGTFHCEIDRCGESKGLTTACSRMPERDGKNQRGDSPKQAGSRWFARPYKWCKLVSSRRLGFRCHDIFLWGYLCSVLIHFRPYAFIEAAALRSIVLRYAGAPMIATRVFFFSSFCLVGDVSFPSILGEYVVRFPLPDGVFLPFL